MLASHKSSLLFLLAACTSSPSGTSRDATVDNRETFPESGYDARDETPTDASLTDTPVDDSRLDDAASGDSSIADSPRGDTSTDTATDAATDAHFATPSGTIVVVVTRSVSLRHDGRGTLWIDLGPSCPYTEGGSATISRTVPGTDMSRTDWILGEEFTDVSPGTWRVWGWLDDNGDGYPFPSSGDPTSDFLVGCETAVVTDTEGALVGLDLNTLAEF